MCAPYFESSEIYTNQVVYKTTQNIIHKGLEWQIIVKAWGILLRRATGSRRGCHEWAMLIFGWISVVTGSILDIDSPPLAV